MDSTPPQAPHPQLVELPRKRTGRKRIAHLLPELRRRIPALFDLGVPAERIGEDLGTSRAEVLEELIRDVRRKGPERAASVIGMRRAV